MSGDTAQEGPVEDHRSPGQREEAVEPTASRRRYLGIVLGPVLAVVVYVLMPGALPHELRLTAAVAVLMAVWWVTEAIPMAATALVPLLLFPALGTVDVSDVGASYGNDIIFLFLGGFLLALSMQRWNLHRRIALLVVRAMGTKPTMLVAGFMAATGFLSMWVSNTATAVMMLPIGVSVLLLVARVTDVGDTTATTATGVTSSPTGQSPPGGGDESPTGAASGVVHGTNLGTALMLGIAYAASLGSLGTIIGTPPNALLVGYLSANHGIQIGFGQWMLVGLPLAIVFLTLTWLVLIRLYRPEIDDIPGGRELIGDELAKLGPMSSGEKRVLAVFALAATSWISVPLIFEDPPISDAGIAVAVGLILFLAPAGAARGVRLLDWNTALGLPWGVLLLFGGGLALSGQFTDSGLSEWIGEQAAILGFIPTALFVLLLVAGVLLLTELTSNTATAATFIPIAGGLAIGLGADVILFTMPVAIAATCTFMLPVATPPNAIAYGSGYVTIGQMVKAGVWINLLSLVLITTAMLTLATWVFSLVW